MDIPPHSNYNSVLYGKDWQALEILISLHNNIENPIILDVTYNTGKMWKKCKFKPIITMDIDPAYNTNIVGDFRDIPLEDNSVNIIIFDPPHLPTVAASQGSSKIYEKIYGITNNEKARSGDNVNNLFLPFLIEAKRVLNNNGIILAKIADITHNHRYQWQHIHFINMVNAVNMTPCDLLIKSDPAAGNLKSSKWKNIKHLRKNHCYWIVVRNSTKCEI